MPNSSTVDVEMKGVTFRADVGQFYWYKMSQSKSFLSDNGIFRGLKTERLSAPLKVRHEKK